MKLEPFLLDQWLGQKTTHKIQYDLATSMGPVWTLQQLFEFMNSDEERQLFETELVFSEAPGMKYYEKQSQIFVVCRQMKFRF